MIVIKFTNVGWYRVSQNNFRCIQTGLWFLRLLKTNQWLKITTGSDTCNAYANILKQFPFSWASAKSQAYGLLLFKSLGNLGAITVDAKRIHITVFNKQYKTVTLINFEFLFVKFCQLWIVFALTLYIILYIQKSVFKCVTCYMKVSFGAILTPVGLGLLGYGFGAFFQLLPGSSISSIMLIYGFPLSLLGFALSYAQLKPVPLKATQAGYDLRDEQSTDIQKQVFYTKQVPWILWRLSGNLFGCQSEKNLLVNLNK